MKLILEAMIPSEGVGIVRFDERRLRLVRPPYALSESPELQDGAVENAVITHGFFSLAQEFASWHEVIEFLRQQVVSTRRVANRDIPEAISAGELVNAAPIEVLLGFLNRIENELIPQRQFDLADEILLAVLVRDDQQIPLLRGRAVSLLKHNKTIRNQVESNISLLANSDVRFKSLLAHGLLQRSNQIAEKIKARGSVLSLVA